MRHMRRRWWAVLVAGSIVLTLGQNLQSEAGLQSSPAKRRSTLSAAQATNSSGSRLSIQKTQRLQPQRTPPGVQPRRSQKSQVKSHTLRLTRSSTRRRYVRLLGRSVLPSTVESSSSSFSENSPPLPSPRTFAAALLADAETGQVLFSLNDHRQWPTASLAKMMVALLTLEAVERREASLNDPVVISRRASEAKGRTIRLRPGEEFPLEELLQAMMVTSANDAAVALAEHLKGSVEACVIAMNKRAQQLGMQDTIFRTPNGLPPSDGSQPDLSSAADLAILGRTLAKHPLLLQWTSLNRIPFREGRILLPNTNHLVGRVPGVDGLKTGFTVKARYNLVTTAQRGSLRLIAIVLGGQSSGLRFHTAENLLEWGFAHFTRMSVIEGGQPLGTEVRVEQGSISTLQPVAASAASLLVRKGEADDVHVVLQVPSVIAAPITRDQVLGHVVVRNNDQTIAVIPAVSPWDIPRAHWSPARH